MKTLEIIRKKDYAIVRLNRGKVNAINPELVQDIRTCFKSIELDKSINGVILTGSPHYFSAGLDLITLYQFDRDALHTFFRAFGSMYIELVNFSKPFVCAISGHAPAGGTVLAMTADYRVMTKDPKYVIGLNELAVNIQISQPLIDGYSFWIGERLATNAILDGRLFTPQEAMNIGLVNEICTLDQVMKQAESKLNSYLNADLSIFRNTKLKLRKRWIDKLAISDDEELKEIEAIWWKPEIRNRMKLLVESLSKK